MKNIDFISASRSARLWPLILGRYGGIAKFCQDTGEDYGAIHKYVNGMLKIGDRVARRLEGLINVDSGYLDEDIPRYLTTNIPLLSIDMMKSVAYNPKIFKSDKSFILRQDLIKAYNWNSNALIALIVSDNSMEPTMSEGNYVVIDCAQANIIQNKVYAILIHDDFYIRRLSKSPETGSLIISSDNNIKSSELGHQNYRIIGRVVYVDRVM